MDFDDNNIITSESEEVNENDVSETETEETETEETQIDYSSILAEMNQRLENIESNTSIDYTSPKSKYLLKFHLMHLCNQ